MIARPEPEVELINTHTHIHLHLHIHIDIYACAWSEEERTNQKGGEKRAFCCCRALLADVSIGLPTKTRRVSKAQEPLSSLSPRIRWEIRLRTMLPSARLSCHCRQVGSKGPVRVKSIDWTELDRVGSLHILLGAKTESGQRSMTLRQKPFSGMGQPASHSAGRLTSCPNMSSYIAHACSPVHLHACSQPMSAPLSSPGQQQQQ